MPCFFTPPWGAGGGNPRVGGGEAGNAECRAFLPPLGGPGVVTPG